MKVKIAVAQIRIKHQDIQANVRKITRAFERAGRNNCDFLVLPEECWTGLNYVESYENEASNVMKKTASRLAKQHNIYCVAGTVVEKVYDAHGHHKHNICYVFDRRGDIIGRYAKRHLAPGETGRKPGEGHTLIDTEFGKIGLQICRDVLYPEVSSTTANLGAKIIISPAFWSKFSSLYSNTIGMGALDEHQIIKHLVPARALENEVFFIFCNAAGEYKDDSRKDILLGHSQICEPFVGPTKVAKHNRQMYDRKYHIFVGNQFVMREATRHIAMRKVIFG